MGPEGLRRVYRIQYKDYLVKENLSDVLNSKGRKFVVEIIISVDTTDERSKDPDPEDPAFVHPSGVCFEVNQSRGPPRRSIGESGCKCWTA